MVAAQGEYEVTASDGTTRAFPTGSVLLLEDRSGKGHANRMVGDVPVLVFAVQIAE